jgi:hypothetical protein
VNWTVTEALERVAGKASTGGLNHTEAPDMCSQIAGIARAA